MSILEINFFISKNYGPAAHLSFYILGEFELIPVNYNLFLPDDKKKGNRHLDKQMKPMNSQISRWKDSLLLISLSTFFSDLFVYRVN